MAVDSVFKDSPPNTSVFCLSNPISWIHLWLWTLKTAFYVMKLCSSSVEKAAISSHKGTWCVLWWVLQVTHWSAFAFCHHQWPGAAVANHLLCYHWNHLHSSQNGQISAFLICLLKAFAPPEVHSNLLVVPLLSRHLDDRRPPVHNMGFQNVSNRVWIFVAPLV